MPTQTSLERYEALQSDFLEFTYIVSHDFQAPLRHIREFSRLLLNKLSDKVGDREQEYVRVIDASILRCESMMAALLAYSRLNTRGEPFTEVDCNVMVEQAVGDLRRQLKMTKVTLSIEPLPVIIGDSSQIQQLFSQLIDNAIKFRRPDSISEVHIHAKRHANGWEFYVEDNGIGLPAEYESQVYTLFRKLDPNSPGVGVGLTLCKKIVQRHSGKISFRKNNEQGTVFTVFLPGELNGQ